jgi:hypothetical protein
MPKNQTKFNTSWLCQTDVNNDSVKIWLKHGSTSTTFKCSLCKTTNLDCGNQGWKAIEQHMNNNKHKKILDQWKKNLKFTVSTQPSSSSSISSSTLSSSNSIPILKTNKNKNKPLSLKEQITKAEILWSLNVAQKGFIYSSCDELNELFSSMFRDSAIATKFSIHANKMSYMVSHDLGPYFKKK